MCFKLKALDDEKETASVSAQKMMHKEKNKSSVVCVACFERFGNNVFLHGRWPEIKISDARTLLSHHRNLARGPIEPLSAPD